jgi:aminoglycoside/choline kinase family phosphotransferase
MQDRQAALAKFLDKTGWGAASVTWRTGDASYRRYARLVLGQQSAILMDAPPPKEDVRPFLDIGATLGKAGLTTPSILAADEALGFLVLEDFGDSTYTALLNGNADAAPLYLLATDALIQLRRHLSARPVGLLDFDPESRVGHLSTFLDWLWSEILPPGPTSSERAAYNALWLDALQQAPTLGEGLVHRDFHVDNLMLLDGRSGVAACGVLDFQDAGWGPFAYDLASLVEDARRDLAPDVKNACLEHYVAAFPHLTADEMAAAIAVHGAQRHLRVAGLWVRLWRRDAKPGYLKHMARTWTLLEGSMEHPLLSGVGAFMAEVFPTAAREQAIALVETAS